MRNVEIQAGVMASFADLMLVQTENKVQYVEALKLPGAYPTEGPILALARVTKRLVLSTPDPRLSRSDSPVANGRKFVIRRSTSLKTVSAFFVRRKKKRQKKLRIER